MNDTVLVVSGLDPSAGAGVAADIETINQFGVTPLPLVSALTVQNTESVASTNAIDGQILSAQFEHLSADVDVSAVKIGLLCSESQVLALEQILETLKDKPVVLDPILSASTGDVLNTAEALKTLLPWVDVLTPNVSELAQLAPEMSEAEAVASLPCAYVLVTTTDISETDIEHRLYTHGQLSERFHYPKLPGNYHGSGCTLSSAISALLASGVEVPIAIKRALEYSYQSLLTAKTIGKMQYHPNRQVPQ